MKHIGRQLAQKESIAWKMNKMYLIPPLAAHHSQNHQ